MNGNGQNNRYSQRGTQTPPRPTVQQRPTVHQRPIGNSGYHTAKSSGISSQVPMAFWVVFSVVLVALVLSLITMTVLLFTVEADGDASSNKTKNESVNKDEGKNNSISQNGSTVLKPPATVPSRSNYIANNSQNVTTIDGISSEAAIIVNMDSYEAIGTKNADTRISPASMTKVMTLLVACEEIAKDSNDISLNELLTVTQAQVTYKSTPDKYGEAPSGELFYAGEQIKLKDFLYLIIYDSNTIACQAVAERIAGSESEFVKLMNNKAKDMGLTNTNFVNSTGLESMPLGVEGEYSGGHYTTCREMAAIMAYALDNTLAKQILSSYAGYSITIHNPSSNRESKTLKKFTGWYSGENRFYNNPRLSTSTVKAGKTGWEYTPTATFVTYAEGKNGGKYICVVVGRIDTSGSTVSAEMSTSDTKKIYNTYIK